MNLSSPASASAVTARNTPAVSAAVPAAPKGAGCTPTASERVLAAELEARGEAHDALSMMVSSVVRMVQAGRTRDSRWKAS